MVVVRFGSRSTLAVILGLLSSTAAVAAQDCDPDWSEAVRGAVLRIAHYPSTHTIRAHLDLSAIPRAAEIQEATLLLTQTGSEAAVVEAAVDPREAARSGGLQALVQTPALAFGSHTLRARFRSRDCERIDGPEVHFEARLFGWEGNRLGEEVGVIPPFTPLVVTENRVDAVLRAHTVSTSGLWTQVVAAQKPLLARPMQWIVVVDGAPRTVVARAAQIRATAQDRVDVTTDLAAGPLVMKFEGRFEIDGLYRVRLKLSGPRSTRIDRLDLVIPLASERATLMNAITDETRIHWLGAVPPPIGTVWRSIDAPRRQLDSGFVPYLWVGDEERGLAWLAESTSDFWFAPGTSMAELRRRAGAVELVVHFASQPGPLGRERTLEFALQATPVKPRPEKPGSWRLWQLACDAGDQFIGICPLPAGFYWGTETRYGNVSPRDGGESVFRWMVDARRERSLVPPIDAWIERWRVSNPDRAEVKASLEYTMRVLALPSRAAVVYMNAQGTAFGPEFAVYGDEWRPAPFGDREGGDEPPVRELGVIPRASYRDRLLFHLDRLLASGAADGVFFDNTYLRASFDDRIGAAYRGDDGRLHPGVEIFAMRELLRRAQMLVYERRGAWWNVAHLTTTPISAIHGWAGMSLDGEWKYGDADFQDRFPLDLLRASALGSQMGTAPIWMPGVQGASGARAAELERQQFGMTALHEIKVMATFGGALGDAWRLLIEQGYGDPNCQIGHYWDEDPIVNVVGVDAKALTIRCGDQITVLVVNFGEGGLAELSARTPTGGWACRDLERRFERFGSTERGCRFPLARHSVRMIEMSPR